MSLPLNVVPRCGRVAPADRQRPSHRRARRAAYSRRGRTAGACGSRASWCRVGRAWSG